MSRIIVILLASLLALAGLFWLRHENNNLSRSLEKANRIAGEQKTTNTMLKNQLNVAAEQSQRKELAQVAMRDKLTEANLLAFRREQAITRLLNENDAFRRWYRADLPDAVRRLHQRAACTNAAAGDCVQRLPEGQPLPDAGQRPAD
ncbi:Rz-like lysis system protein LysB [Klebsiella pneumoniae]|uniref:Rz-like lysis system protein LysB n=1 Tax=Klebsiella pneumoniae TaxID=573 RepID=UPI0039B4034D